MSIRPVQVFAAGAAVRCRAFFANRDLTDYERTQFQASGAVPAGVGVDPPSVSVTVRAPDGSEQTYPAVRYQAGSYFYDVDTTGLKGRWTVHVFSPAGGFAQGAGEGKFITELDV